MGDHDPYSDSWESGNNMNPGIQWAAWTTDN